MRHSLGLAFAIAAATACGGGTDEAGVFVSAIEFGGTDCGATAIPRILTITNNTPNGFNFTTALSGGEDSFYTIIPPDGYVLPRSQFQVMVHSKPIPASSELTDNLYGETVTITTDLTGDEPRTVPIRQTARGAAFELSAPTINFAAPVPLGTAAELPITVTNTGNAPGMVAVEGANFAFDIVHDAPIAPGASVEAKVRFSPAHTTLDSQGLRVTAKGATCGEPTMLVASGTGTAVGLAAHAVPTSSRNRNRSADTLCVRTTTGVVACGGSNRFGVRGVTDDFLLGLLPPGGGKGGQGGIGGGVAAFDVFNVVHTEDGYLTDVVDLVGGMGFYCALRETGDVWCWGDYLGLGAAAGESARTHTAAVQVAPPGSVTALSAGYTYRCSVAQSNGGVTCRTLRATDNDSVPTTTWKVLNATAVTNNGGGGYALLADGTVMSFGRNNSGERGNGEFGGTDGHDLPTAVTGLTGITQVVAGGRGTSRANRFGCARKDDETAWCWGDNRHGQLGNGSGGTGSGVNQSTPQQVTEVDSNPLTGVSEITAGKAHACARVGGTVWCWGRGDEGQIGSGNLSRVVSRAEPTDPELTNATKIEAAGTHATCAVLATGALRCWGGLAAAEYTAPEPIPAFEP